MAETAMESNRAIESLKEKNLEKFKDRGILFRETIV